MVRKALLKNNQASSTVGMRSMSFQDTPARSIRKACLQKCFRERLTVMRGGRLLADPLRRCREVYLEGELVRMISMWMPVFTDLGLYQVGSLINCVRLRASSLDCRMAGMLSMSQFRSPNSTSAEDA